MKTLNLGRVGGRYRDRPGFACLPCGSRFPLKKQVFNIYNLQFYERKQHFSNDCENLFWTCVWIFAFKLANLDLTQSRFFCDRVMLMLDLALNLLALPTLKVEIDFCITIISNTITIISISALPTFSERVPRCTSGGLRWRAFSTWRVCLRKKSFCLEEWFKWNKVIIIIIMISWNLNSEMIPQ